LEKRLVGIQKATIQAMIKFISLNLIIVFFSMSNTLIQMKSPNKGVTISFEIVEQSERQRLLEQEVKTLYKVHKNVFFEMPVHLLKNGDYLYGITKNGYAFLFHDIQNLDLFLDRTGSYYDVAAHFINGFCYYGYYLYNDKVIELMSDSNKVQLEGYNRRPEWQVYQLPDGAILYMEQRTETAFSGRWYPDLKNFEFFYDNRYAP
jgi:hypothetical protein